jgi:hypothetical protein
LRPDGAKDNETQSQKQNKKKRAGELAQVLA